ncbi:MAG: hypothetical protein IPK82_13330 [Polyangiaceae bacterium]|nr:hypothetical protein [Polyangiaceae bacterium]
MTMPSPPGGFGPPGPQHAPPTAAGTQLPSVPQGVAPAIPAPPTRGPKSRAAGIALGGIVTFVIAGGAATGILLCTSGKKFDTKVPLEKAPPVTVAVMGGPAHGDLAPSDSVTKEATISALAARFCGGVDIVGELFAARYRDAASAVAPLAGLRDPLSMTDPLKCGKALSEAMEGRSIIQLGAFDGRDPRRVAAVRHKGTVQPFVGFVDKSFGSLLGRCVPPKAGDKPLPDGPCGEKSAAGFIDGNVYYGGSGADVAFFAAAYRASGGSRDSSEPASTLADLAKRLDPADSWELRYRPESIDLALPCVAAAPSDAVLEMLKLCLPPGHENDGTLLAADVKATAVLRQRPDSGKSVGFEYVLWAKDSEVARSAETKLNTYAEVWRKTVEQNESAILKVVASGKDPRDAGFRAVARSWVDALKRATVKASGDMVYFSVSRDLFEDDKAQMKTLQLATSEDVQKAGMVLDSLLLAKSPSPEVLGHFLGADLASWVLAPNATVADCKQIAKHASDLSNAPDFPTDQFLPMTEMVEMWGGTVPENEREEIKIDEKACVERRLLEASKTCLVSAKSIADMNKCPIPVSPETATFRTRIQGKWRAQAMTGGNVWDRQKFSDQARGSTLVVEGPNAELTGGYDEMRGELGFIFVRTTVSAEFGGEATLARIKIGSRRAEMTFVGDKLYFGTWDVQSGKKKPAIYLERVTSDK